jgi:hypothetical protein
VLDPKTFQASATPLWTIPDYIFIYTFSLLILFIICISLSYKYALLIKVAAFQNISKKFELFPSKNAIFFLDFLTFISMISTLLISSLLLILPRALLTPVTYLSSIFIIPATYVWYWYFSGEKIGGRRYLYLLPGILAYFFQPFREQILTIASCIIIPLIVINPNFKIKKLIIQGILAFVVITFLNYSYRDIVWGNQSTKQKFDVAGWVNEPFTSPWVQAVSRFHGFDSFLLTVSAVPRIFPFQNRNIPIELITTTFLPRILYVDKSENSSSRGIFFSESVWSIGMINEKVSARIAPSMPGDLFSAYGIIMLVIGGLIWGFFIGMFEKWQLNSSDLVKAVLITFIGTKVFSSVERDFIIVVSYLIQILIVVYFLFALLKPKQLSSI